MSGSGISLAICKSAPRSGQVTMPAPHHSFLYRLDALHAAQPTESKHWRHWLFYDHRHTSDKYLISNNLLANQAARKASPFTLEVLRWLKSQSQNGRLPELLFTNINLPNQSQWSRSPAIANNVPAAVSRTAKCCKRNLQPSCDYHQSSVFGFVNG